MRDQRVDRAFGRQAFGHDPAGYHAARPAYPGWVFEVLCDRCELAPHRATFEIGAGTGLATGRLLELGANPLVAVEPDGRLAAFLRAARPDPALTVVVAPFEDAILPEASFDLGLSATAFHWLAEDAALAKVARLLRPGGWWAMAWNVFGGTYSSITARADRDAVLAELGRIARDEFHGRVTRNMVTSLYVARRDPAVTVPAACPR